MDPDQEKLNIVMHKKSLPSFYEADRALLAQYYKIMKPATKCLDSVQTEENAYMDISLPTIKLMKGKMAALKNDSRIAEEQDLSATG